MRYLLGFILWTWAASAGADVVDIRSGEHDAFTRLVFTLPKATPRWSLAGKDTDYTLRIETDSPEYAASTVFERIPRTRLASLNLETGNPEIGLRLACPCDVEAFAFGDRSIVVDIRTPQSNEEQAEARPAPEAEQAPGETVLRLPLQERAVVSQRWTSLEGFVDENARSRDQRDKLLRAVARAASQGLVVPNLAPPAEASPSLSPERKDTAKAKAVVKEVPPDNLRTETTYDQAFQQVEAALPGKSCLPDRIFDIVSWGDGDTPPAALSMGRANLFNEAGVVDEQAVLKRAQTLLFQTFGAEARQVLELVAGSDEKNVLLALADIMDSEVSDDADTFEHTGDCLGKVALWAFLAKKIVPNEAQEKVILREFAALPAHLRRHLGPRLADGFLQLGNPTIAETVSGMIERVSDEQDLTPRFIQARIGAESGQYASAEAALTEMVQKGERITPEALTSLVNLYEERDFAPMPDMVALLEAYALEHRRSVLGPDLRQAHAIAAALSGQFQKAFDVAQDVQEFDGQDAAQALRSRLVDRLISQPDEASLLRIALGRRLGINHPLDRNASLALSERLMSLGFPGQAEQVLAEVPFRMTDRERLLRARLALAENRPRQAEAELLGIEGAEAQELRAEIRASAGDHRRAAEAFADVGQEEAAARQVWLAGDWEQVQDIGTPAAQNVVRHIMIAPPLEAEGEGESTPLARNRIELEQSSDLRQAVDALLAETLLPDF